MIVLVLVLNGIAIATGFVAIALLAIIRLNHPIPIAATAFTFEIALLALVATNTVQFAVGSFRLNVPPQEAFVAMTATCGAIVFAAWALLRIACIATDLPWSNRASGAFAATAALMYAYAAYRFAFAPGLMSRDAPGYLASALFGACSILISIALLVIRFARMSGRYRRLAATGMAIFGGSAAVIIINEIVNFGSYFGLPAIPLSPLVFTFANIFVIVLATGTILSWPRGVESDQQIATAEVPADTGGHQISEGAIRSALLRYDLSAREREIAELLLEGLDNAGIGAKLFISPHTVKNHITSIYRKTGAEGRMDLIRVVRRGSAS